MSGGRLRERQRDPERLDALALYDRFRPKLGDQFVSDTGPRGAAAAFVENVRGVAQQASTLHGWRVQNLFRGVVVSLDAVQFIKEEDNGRYYFTGPDIKVPDFRIIADEGTDLLVEAKNVSPSKPFRDFTIRKKELDALHRYCDLVGKSKLMIAIYWSAWNLWTLVDPIWLSSAGTNMTLSLRDAILKNEMSLVGDRSLGTEMPLAMRFHGDGNISRIDTLSELLQFTVSRVEFLVAGRTVVRPDERRIAYTLLMFGGWSDLSQVVEKDGENIVSLTFEVRPEESDPNQPFHMHGPLSSLFSSYFALATLDSQNNVRSIDAEYDVGGFGSLVEEPYEGDVLRLWRFTITSAPHPSTTS